MSAWKNCTLSSSPITRNADRPDTETARTSPEEAGKLEDGEIGTSKGVLSEAMMTWAAKGLIPMRRRKISHCQTISIVKVWVGPLHAVVSAATGLMSPMS
jgi:hypothetical protein